MAAPKGTSSYRMVTDYCAVNDTITPAGLPTPNLADKASLFAGAAAWCTLDMLQGYREVPLSEANSGEGHHGHAGGIVTPRRIPPGVPCATGYF